MEKLHTPGRCVLKELDRQPRNRKQKKNYNITTISDTLDKIQRNGAGSITHLIFLSFPIHVVYQQHQTRLIKICFSL